MMGASRVGPTLCATVATTSPAIGKLHYRGHPDEDYGFTESLLAMHITGGVGDVTHLVRDPDDIRTTGKNLIASAGPRGEQLHLV